MCQAEGHKPIESRIDPSKRPSIPPDVERLVTELRERNSIQQPSKKMQNAVAQPDIGERIKAIKAAVEETTRDFDPERLQARLRRLGYPDVKTLSDSNENTTMRIFVSVNTARLDARVRAFARGVARAENKTIRQVLREALGSYLHGDATELAEILRASLNAHANRQLEAKRNNPEFQARLHDSLERNHDLLGKLNPR